MSGLNISTLPHITSSTLRSYILNPSTAPSFAVIDVRDADHLGGHIHSSLHVPTSQHAHALPELARTLASKRLVVFHCMLCQQRGPKAALEYARARERLLGREDGRCASADMVAEALGGDGEGKEQVVAFLEGGFAAWQAKGFGEDARLTEGYDRRLWEEGMD